jgi:hypothetical protein
MTDRKFLMLYSLFLAVVFGAMAGGIFFDFVYTGNDPLTNTGPQTIYIMHYPNGTYTVSANAEHGELKGGQFFQLPFGCTKFVIALDLPRHAVIVTEQNVTMDLCA